MASSIEFVEYIADQLRDAGEITYRKMFGEYGLYCNGKIVSLICEDQFFVKVTEEGKRICGDATEVSPYEGSKPYLLIEEIDDREKITELIRETCRVLPEPKPKKPKAAKITKEKKAVSTEKLDFKKRYKDLYLPKKQPSIIEVPKMKFIMVDGEGDPNTSECYKNALEILYGLSYGIKMSKKSGDQPTGYVEYVVAPLEGFWSAKGEAFDGIEIEDKSQFIWTSMIRQPDFVTEELFVWAKEKLLKKNPGIDFSRTRFETYEEGLCCQIMHLGPYDDEPATIERMEQFISDSGYVQDLDSGRRHHEIYLGDPRKTKPENLKTVIRHPIKKR